MFSVVLDRIHTSMGRVRYIYMEGFFFNVTLKEYFILEIDIRIIRKIN